MHNTCGKNRKGLMSMKIQYTYNANLESKLKLNNTEEEMY